MKIYCFRVAPILLIALFSLVSLQAKSETQDTFRLSLNQAIELAQRQSLSSFLAKNNYLAGYWSYKKYRASFLPSLNLTTSLFDYSNGFERQWNSATKTYSYENSEAMTNSVGLSIRQNVSFTGGVFSINGNSKRLWNSGSIPSYNSTPFSIGVSQPLNGFNAFKWQRLREPLIYEQRKKEYIQTQENIARNTVNVFFDLISSQIELTISSFNYQNADTLYRIGKGRFEIGTITQDELLDLELSFLNAKSRLTRSKYNLERSQSEFNSTLRFRPNTQVVCILPDKIPTLKIDSQEALDLALKNNPTIIGLKLNDITGRMNLADARSERFDATLNLSYGSSKRSDEFISSFASPLYNSSGARVSLNVPLIDWGKTRGNYLMSKSNYEAEKYRIEQQRIDFERNISQTIMEFNLQEEQLVIAAKADTIGQLGHKVTMQRFMIGKLDVLKLNSARQGMESARKAYINTLEGYWNYYYSIRMLTLYDFEKKESLDTNFEKILKEQRY